LKKKLYLPLVFILAVSLLVFACTISLQPVPQPEGILQVHFIDVGQGDAVLILSPDGKAGLIDGGEAGSGVRQYLKTQGVKRLEFIVATHPHDDHIGGLPEVLRAFPVAKVITNGQEHTTTSYERLLDAVISAKADYIEVRKGDTIPLGDLNLQVLNPTNQLMRSLNENSVVLRLEYGKISFLFSGDAEKGTESRLVSEGVALKSDILKVGHHGSRSSSTLPFLTAVSPSTAVYMAKTGNSYGHPHPETLQSLALIGTKVYGTDINGTVVVTTDGESYNVSVERTENIESLFLQIISVTNPVSPGGEAEVKIKTLPGAKSQIKVFTKSGTSQAKGLEDKTADKDGYAIWQWRVGSTTAEGTWRIEVSAGQGRDFIVEETSYTVKK
jgi:beta-lactamase superfamily II metal-dependent hydrolase